MNKKLGYAGIAALLLLVIAGCGDKPTAAPANGNNLEPAVVNGAGENGSNNNTAEGGDQVVPSASPEATEEPGNNSVNSTPAPTATEKPAAAEKQSQSIDVYYTDPQLLDLVTAKATIHFADPVEKYSDAFKALQSSDNQEQIPLWGKIELKSLKFEDGQILMDIHKPQDAQLGAGGESMAMSALAKTFFQFDEVKSIEMLVDGQKVESLMGHVDLEHPMTRENSL
ncbi:GerMN domain-containing protein [Paenibacillus sp. JW14]|uniref:GerMN domain-containing protein n=2 Tax=Paenibacillus agri TaxID=2744309 RepID=A0A850ERQ0_9BACL|nr:GerMN domain-containing protein [Paenibacillus agri]